MAKKKERILEAYCIRKRISRKNPLGFKDPMQVFGSCVTSVAEYGKESKNVGVGTVKVIPVNKKFMEGFTKASKNKRKKK